MLKNRGTTSTLRPMADNEALEWLVSFVREDLDTLESPGAWVDIGWNLARFLAEAAWVPPENREQIKTVQSAVRAVLGNLSREGGTYIEGASIGTRYAERKDGKLHVGYEAGRIENNVVDVTLRHLASIDLDRLGQCKRCHGIFLGQRGQKYCGKPCASAAASEAYRKRNRDEINKKALGSYEKKLQARIGDGPRIKVRRRKKEGQ